MTYLAKRITESSKKSFGMYAKAAALNGTERDLIHMELGSPHADTPEAIKQATIRSLLDGNVHYSHFQGLPKLRQALAQKLTAKNDLDYSPEEIVVTNGLTHASYAAFMACLDPGDEVILLEPYYPQHVGKIELAGAKPVFAKLDAKNRFSINPALIEEKITPKTKMIALINPCNPTGRVYSREELQGLADLAIKHDLLIASDEVYEEILFDHARHISIASLPGMRERTISMFAFTKSFAMDGWGSAISRHRRTGGRHPQDHHQRRHPRQYLHPGRRLCGGDRAGGGASATGRGRPREAGHRRQPPQPDAGRHMRLAGRHHLCLPGHFLARHSAQTLAETILDKANVVVEAGSFYGAAGEGHLRVCFGSQSTERVTEAMDRLQRFFGSL